MSRIRWVPLLDRAAQIVESYDTLITLRGLFYRLVSEELLPSEKVPYKRLSALTAKGRRDGTFPDLIDLTRNVEQPLWFGGVADARRWLHECYRRDRTKGQAASVYLGIEKHALKGLLHAWFDDFGLPILPLGGWASQSFVDQVRRHVDRSGRPAILVYGGDFDPSGEDIDRDFVDRTDCFSKVIRVGLSWNQVEQFGLPPRVGKSGDSRAKAFAARHGQLVQVELDALPPDILRSLFQAALDEFWDASAFHRVIRQEQRDRRHLREVGAT